MFRTKTSKLLVVLLVLCLVGVAAFAQVQNKKFNDPKNASQTYYMCTFVMGVEYWDRRFRRFKDCAKQLGVKAVYTGTGEYKLPEQVTAFEQIFAKNPAGIALSPIDDAGFVEPVKAAIAKKIPVVTFASNTSTDKPAFITSDNVKEGQTAARAIAKALGGKGKVMATRNTQSNHQIRVNTFVETMKKEFPDIQVVAEVLTSRTTRRPTRPSCRLPRNTRPRGGLLPRRALWPRRGAGSRGARRRYAQDQGPVLRYGCHDPAAPGGGQDVRLHPAQRLRAGLSLHADTVPHQERNAGSPQRSPGDWRLRPEHTADRQWADIITPETAKYFYTDRWQKRRGSTNFKAW